MRNATLLLDFTICAVAAQMRALVSARAHFGWVHSLKHILWCDTHVRVPIMRQFRLFSSTGESNEGDGFVKTNEGDSATVFEGQGADRILQKSLLSHSSNSELSNTPSSSLSPKKKVGDIELRQSSAPRLVPWTSNHFFKDYKFVKTTSTTKKKRSFAAMLRESTFVQLGNFIQREILGVVIENANDSDLYVDIGGKFLAVVPQPENAFYPRGSLIRVRLRDPEMANRFMVNMRAISLLEADVTLLGPYRGQLIPAAAAASDHQINREVVSLEHWKLQ